MSLTRTILSVSVDYGATSSQQRFAIYSRGVLPAPDNRLNQQQGKITPNERTVRIPRTVTGKTSHDLMQEKRQRNMVGRGGVSMYSCIARQPPLPWGQFSNNVFPLPVGMEAAGLEAARDESLEAFHNIVHAWVGATQVEKDASQLYGDMEIPSLFSFDPIFWLHHW